MIMLKPLYLHNLQVTCTAVSMASQQKCSTSPKSNVPQTRLHNAVHNHRLVYSWESVSEIQSIKDSQTFSIFTYFLPAVCPYMGDLLMIINDVKLDVMMLCAELGTLSKALLDRFGLALNFAVTSAQNKICDYH